MTFAIREKQILYKTHGSSKHVAFQLLKRSIFLGPSSSVVFGNNSDKSHRSLEFLANKSFSADLHCSTNLN